MNFQRAFHVLEELSGDEPDSRLDFAPRAAVAPLAPRVMPQRRDITQADLERAREEGIEQGRAIAGAQYEAKLQEQRATWGAELEAARDTWEEATGRKLWASLEEGLGMVRQELAATLVNALEPFIRQKLSEAAVETLTQSMVDLIAEVQTTAVHVVGPSQLVEAFERNASGRASISATIDNSSTDLVVRVGASLISTRIGEWLGKLEIQD